MTKLYGWYSQTAVDKGYGVGVYSCADGGYCFVTGITRDIDGNGYGFPDKLFYGEVVNFVEEFTPESPEEETPSGAVERRIMKDLAAQETRTFKRMYKYLMGD